MGFLSGLLSGGAALNVLGGMAQQYNKISDERRAEEFTLKRDKEKYEAEEGLVRLRTKLESESALKQAIAKAKIDKQAKIEVQKLKLQEQNLKNKPKGVAIDFSKYFPENDYFKNSEFLIPKRSDHDESSYYAALKLNFKPQFWKQVFDDSKYGVSGNANYTNDVNAVADTIIDAGLDTLEVINQQNKNGDKVQDIKIMTKGMVDYFASHPVLQKRFEKKYNTTLKTIRKQLGGEIEQNNGSIGEVQVDNKGDAKITFTLDDRYYKTPDGGMQDKNIINTQIKNLNHPELIGLNTQEKMGKLDSMVRFKAPLLEGHGGELINNAVTRLKSKLRNYSKPLTSINNEKEIKAFFEEDEIGKLLATSPELAIDVVAMALPASIKGKQDFKPIQGALMGNQLYSDSQQFKLLEKENEAALELSNANKLGFKDIASRDYKQKALQNVMTPAKELIKLLNAPAEQRVYTGLTQKMFMAWTGAKQQFQEFTIAAREQIAANSGLFDKSAIDALQKLQKETDDYYKRSQDSALSDKERKAALFNYYAGVLTFTMAAAVQGGSEGSVDSRTISDKDVQLWKSILNLGTNLGYRSGQTAILSAIVKDAEIKVEILKGFKNSDDRIKSAAKILNESYYGGISISSYAEMQDKLDSKGIVTAGQAVMEVDEATYGSGQKATLSPEGGEVGLFQVPEKKSTARDKALFSGNQ
jgi:hypothetical protein